MAMSVAGPNRVRAEMNVTPMIDVLLVPQAPAAGPD
jgi:biopolymer transport protein ExbD